MFAIVEIAGSQERVEEGAKLRVPTLPHDPGSQISLDRVLLIAGNNDDIRVGNPCVSGATVEIAVLSHGLSAKIRSVKFRRRKRHLRVRGHRQGYTDIEVKKIVS